ncbi:sigma-70 family RNA polymerase sigma factor [Microvirga pudoricolor]|uniref:sigma-70 family RNA polymerase sigma factor n=1 Tax=Microvirga pudoricolor TaxID=2778729 RepID=UPI00194E2568|nr:sigma-70 family RNA polymerase sigma factor [Microvirga pudoricolor]MBM6593227.1 sigma-70 family RNA polymerase sigma factor [Microvirga pudoricolor]
MPPNPDVIDLLPRLRRYAQALTRDSAAAEDLVQDALVRAYERRHTFRPGGNLRGWLMSVLHNVFVDGRRRAQAETRKVEGAAGLADEASQPDQEWHVRLRQVGEAFSNLPDEQREALYLVSIEGLSYQEAAQTLEIPVGTLMSRLGRGRAALRAFEEGRDGADTLRPRPQLRVVGGQHE